MESRKSPLKPLWRYQYPVIDDRVQNLAVTRFLTELVNAKESSTAKTLRDFKRGISIDGENISNDTEEKQFLEKLLGLTQKSSAYSPEGRKQLITYLSKHGGQDNNMLVQHLIRNNHFLPLNSNETCHSSSTQNLLASNWTINDEGKIAFNYSVEVQSIEIKDLETKEIYLLLAGEGNQSIQRLPMDPEIILARKKSKNGLQPLFRVNYSIELDVKNGVVEPAVKNIQVENYNNEITIQESKFVDERDPKFLAIQLLLSIISKYYSAYKDYPEIQNQLIIIRSLITDSNNRKNLEPLKIAAEYTRNIQCRIKKFIRQDEFKSIEEIFQKTKEFKEHYQKLFGSTILQPMKIHELQEHLGEHGITKLGSITNSNIDLDEIADVFGVIYIGLQEIYHRYHPISSAELSSSQVAVDWSQMPAAHQPASQSYDDFRNGCEIHYTQVGRHTSDKDIQHLITDLANDAAINRDERELLADWINKKGGTLPDRLIDFMLNSENFDIELTKNIDLDTHSLHLTAIAEPPLHKWNIAMNGSVELSSVYYISSLYYEEIGLGIMRNRQSNEAVYVNSPTAPESNASMIRIETKIQLKIEDGKVIPVVTQFDAQSYTRGINLREPEPKPRIINQ